MRLVERAAAGDEAGLPGRLCRAVRDGLGMDGATMSLLTHTDARQLLCVTGDEALRLEQLQFESAEGPCMAASESGIPVVCMDPRDCLSLWPIFGSRLSEELSDIALVLAVPLIPSGGRKPVGSLDVLRHTPWRPRENLVAEATAAAQAVTDILLRRAVHHFGGTEPLPWEPADVIDAHWGQTRRAAGRLAARRDIEVSEALALLRARAFATGRPLPQVSGDLLDEPGD
ncbi:hypothetical protein GCM10010431_65510 [Streptomyces kunmingensis]